MPPAGGAGSAGGRERDIQYVLISVDPERDETASLRRYAAYFDPELIAATGPHAELMRMARALGAFYQAGERRDGRYEVHHGASIYLIDPATRLRAFYAGPHDAARLAQGLAQLREP